jgi:hypothetical protein
MFSPIGVFLAPKLAAAMMILMGSDDKEGSEEVGEAAKGGGERGREKEREAEGERREGEARAGKVGGDLGKEREREREREGECGDEGGNREIFMDAGQVVYAFELDNVLRAGLSENCYRENSESESGVREIY